MGAAADIPHRLRARSSVRTASLTLLLFSLACVLSCTAPEGSQGPAGAPGATGPTGPAGKAGAAGATGAAGASGAMGEMGEMGAMGDAGPTGAAGPPGPAGEPGSNASTPTGSVLAFAGLAAAVPAGWALCDGSAVSRTSATYSGLFAVVSTAFGSGDGSSTYNLPDLRGCFVRGTDNGMHNDPNAGTRTASAAGGATGDTPGSLESQATARPTTLTSPFGTDVQGDHTHPVFGSSYQIGFDGTGEPNSLGGGGQPFDPITIGVAGSHSHTVIGGGDNETRPLNISINYIVKL